jgi:hypothetical protein
MAYFALLFTDEQRELQQQAVSIQPFGGVHLVV